MVEIIDGKLYMELYFVFFLEGESVLIINLFNYVYLDGNYEEYCYLSDKVRVVKMFLYCKRGICMVIYFGYYLIL